MKTQPQLFITLEKGAPEMGKIKKKELSEIYKKAEEASFEKKEKNDCSVKAISIACSVDYQTAHEIMENNGRKDKGRTFVKNVRAALKELGWRMEYIDQRKLKRSFPKHRSKFKFITSHSFRRFPSAFEDLPPIVIAFTTDHVFAVMNGENCDWSVNNKLRIKTLYEIVPDWEGLSKSEKSL